MENIAQIQASQPLVSWNQLNERRPRFKKRKKIPYRTLERKLFTLSRMADDVHQTLLMKDAPIRLCVYQEEDELMMDVIALDSNENQKIVFSRDITDEKTPNLIRQMHKQQGLILDYSL